MEGVLCFGNLQLDILCRPLTELPPPGAVHRIDDIRLSLSGNGGDVAAALGRLGIPVELAGYTGADVIGEQFHLELAELGVGTAKLLRHAHLSTGTSIVAKAPSGERTIVYANGANAAFDLVTVPDAWLERPQVVVISSMFILPQFTSAAVRHLFTRAHQHGSITVLNPCWDEARLGLGYLVPALSVTDFFIVSYDDGRQLTGHLLPEDILAELEQACPGTVVLTLGAEGCCFHEAGATQRIPAVTVTAVDMTGAGDTFVAGFIAGLIQGRALTTCAALGCQAASYAVTGPGAYQRIPRLAAIAEEAKLLLQQTQPNIPSD